MQHTLLIDIKCFNCLPMAFEMINWCIHRRSYHFPYLRKHIPHPTEHLGQLASIFTTRFQPLHTPTRTRNNVSAVRCAVAFASNCRKAATTHRTVDLVQKQAWSIIILILAVACELQNRGLLQKCKSLLIHNGIAISSWRNSL